MDGGNCLDKEMLEGMSKRRLLELLAIFSFSKILVSWSKLVRYLERDTVEGILKSEPSK